MLTMHDDSVYMSYGIYRLVHGIYLITFHTVRSIPCVSLHRSVPLETVISIYSAESQYKVIRSNHLHRSRMEDYCSRYMLIGSILHFVYSVR